MTDGYFPYAEIAMNIQKKNQCMKKSPYDKVVCKYDGGYKFEPIIKIRHLSVESERNEKIDCSDVLDRVDQKINQKLL